MNIRSTHAKVIQDSGILAPRIPERVFGQPAPALCPSVSSKLKRSSDVVIAAIVLAMTLPILLTLAIWIKLESTGPVLFRQRRTGVGGKQFTILKFRTMSVTEDGSEVRQACRGDNRITRIGSVLRRTSLDELPQLFNVLTGEMSLVGPRPHALAHDAIYNASIPDYGLRFRCRPGLTGLAQVSGLRGEIRDPIEMQERVVADNYYIDNWSIFWDVKILCATLPKIFFDPKAY